jgi:hypothetical protein
MIETRARPLAAAARNHVTGPFAPLLAPIPTTDRDRPDRSPADGASAGKPLHSPDPPP